VLGRRRSTISDRSSRGRTILGTIEVLAVGLVTIVLIAFAVWFLFFAHNPLLRP
jgi:hypothetical protein